MASVTIGREAFARRAEEYYDRALRAKLEPEHKGEYLFLDVDSGDYEVDVDQLAAMHRARAKHPNTIFYIMRVGYRAVGHMGLRITRGLPDARRDPILRKCRAVLEAMYGDRLKGVDSVPDS